MTPRSYTIVGLLVIAGMSVTSAEARAQLVQGPPGSLGGLFGGHTALDPTRTATRWTGTIDGGAGPDREFRSLGSSLTPETTFTMSTLQVNSRYFRGRTGRFLEALGGGFVNRGPTTAQTLRGGNAGLSGRTSVGGRTSMTGSGLARYEPLVVGVTLSTPGPVAPADPSLPPPSDLTPASGDQRQPWLSTAASIGVTRSWTSRQEGELSVADWRWRPIDGPGFETVSQSLTYRQSWNATDQSQFRFLYRYDRNQQTATEGVQFAPAKIHTATAGLQRQRRLSPERSIALILEGGAAYSAADTSSAYFVEPTGSVTVQVAMNAGWTIAGGLRRDVGVLSGVAPAPFTTDTASLQVGGSPVRRLTLGFAALYARGSENVEAGTFDATTFTGQLQYGLAYWCAGFASYSYYRHRLQDVETAAIGFPDVFQRRSLRVGLSLWLPFYGTF